mmetsp:Transcript_5761/g.8380  ORF Transcript_5761/g.8380 Transcript_5761/m.8380 type:complete len:117 (-) Transcript_5761:150-500(-)
MVNDKHDPTHDCFGCSMNESPEFQNTLHRLTLVPPLDHSRCLSQHMHTKEQQQLQEKALLMSLWSGTSTKRRKITASTMTASEKRRDWKKHSCPDRSGICFPVCLGVGAVQLERTA